MSNEILENLNEEQKTSVLETEGYIRVIAGAGTGKTKALTNRFVYLVQELGVSTANILCVTFTNKAANEMKDRVRNMIGDKATGFICTFHGFAVKFLREEKNKINYPKDFIILDEDDSSSIMREVFKELGLTRQNLTIKKALKIVEGIKREPTYVYLLLELDTNVLLHKINEAKKLEDKIFYRYIYEQRKNFGLDFNDLISSTLYILRKHQDIRLKWQKRFTYIMVDEFQDVSKRQYEIVKILSEYHKNLYVVGDPNQTIYTWRGAKIEYLLKFDIEFENVTTIKLNKNYRSSPEILNVANSLIDKNTTKIENELIPQKEKNVLTIYNHLKNTYEEAKWIAEYIDILHNVGVEYNDITILYRSHFVSRNIEQVFIEKKIPYIIYSGIEFFKRKEIKDILAYLRLIVYNDDLSFLRVVNEPRRGFGEKRINRIKELASRESLPCYDILVKYVNDEYFLNTEAKSFIDLIEKYKKTYKEIKISNLVESILNDSGYRDNLLNYGQEERIDNLKELTNSMIEYENSIGNTARIEEYLQDIALYTNTEQKEKTNSVKMMTIHTAKGLEFPYVFVCGLNEGIFPSSHALTKEQIEEERRLAYVAFTRAENALFLSEAEGETFDGRYRYPSRFIFDIEKQYLKYEVELDKELVQNAMDYVLSTQNIEEICEEEFVVGDRVSHSVYGVGTIKEVYKNNLEYCIQFDKLQSERYLSFSTKLIKV